MICVSFSSVFFQQPQVSIVFQEEANLYTGDRKACSPAGPAKVLRVHSGCHDAAAAGAGIHFEQQECVGHEPAMVPDCLCWISGATTY